MDGRINFLLPQKTKWSDVDNFSTSRAYGNVKVEFQKNLRFYRKSYPSTFNRNSAFPQEISTFPEF